MEVTGVTIQETNNQQTPSKNNSYNMNVVVSPVDFSRNRAYIGGGISGNGGSTHNDEAYIQKEVLSSINNGGSNQNQGAPLYSVSQRVPAVVNTSYSNLCLPPTNTQEQHHHQQQQQHQQGYSALIGDWEPERTLSTDTTKDSSSSEVLSDKLTNNNGDTTASVQSSTVAGSATTSHNESLVQEPTSTTCVYLHNHTAIVMDVEDIHSTTCDVLYQAIINCDELGLNKQIASQLFSLWMVSPLLEVQMKPSQKPYEIRQAWKHLVGKYSHVSYSRHQRDEPKLSFQRNIFFQQYLEEKIKDQKLIELLYEEARHNILEGRYPCEVAHYIMLGGIQARIELGPYNPQVHSTHYFREEQSKYLPFHVRKSPTWTWLPISSKNSAEVRLLEQFKRIPTSATNRKLMKKYLEFCWSLPFYGSAFFEGQIEQPVRGLFSLMTHQDVPVLVGVNSKGVYVIDDQQCTLLLGLRYEEVSWEYARPSREEDPNCLPCLFLQFMVVENGARVSKILQIFSRQSSLMDKLITAFVNHLKSKSNDEPDKPTVFEPTATNENNDSNTHASLTISGNTSHSATFPSLTNKLSKLTLATFDEDGHCIGQMGSWSFGY